MARGPHAIFARTGTFDGARLGAGLLWQVFCLPTLVGQVASRGTDIGGNGSSNSNNNHRNPRASANADVVWLIRFDPDLDAAVLKYLVDATHRAVAEQQQKHQLTDENVEATIHYDNIYWIASNRNFRINPNFPVPGATARN
jgi:hypothetical protein